MRSVRACKESDTAAQSEISTVFCVYGEMIPDNGEDSFCYSAEGSRCLAAVFDGCGGIGSRRYQNLSGKTGAYVASRAASGAALNWFLADTAAPLKDYIDKGIGVCSKHGGSQGRLMGSLGKSFPTTAAVICADSSVGKTQAKCYWAGDSRCYLLDCRGLHQLTWDDVSGEDALSNLSGDGVLTNVVYAGQFELHEREIECPKPCILFSATDGCFSYLRTPMEFEYLILNTLCSAKTLRQWKETLRQALRGYAEDDYTLCAICCGAISFGELQSAFRDRLHYLEVQYITPLRSAPAKTELLWAQYRTDYEV